AAVDGLDRVVDRAAQDRLDLLVGEQEPAGGRLDDDDAARHLLQDRLEAGPLGLALRVVASGHEGGAPRQARLVRRGERRRDAQLGAVAALADQRDRPVGRASASAPSPPGRKRSIGWPTASAAGQPNIASAAEFQSTIRRLSRSSATTASRISAKSD